MTNKVDLEKFTGQNDFNMWRIKMEALLITQGLGDAIDPVIKSENTEASSSRTPEQMAEIDKKARSTIILSLGDSVIREVAKEKTVAGLWAKLEQLQSLSLEEVKSALGTKKLKDKQDNSESESSEGLMARGRSEKREYKGKKQGRSKSKQKHLKCFHCHKEGHFKRDCPERKTKQKEPKEKSGNAAIATEETSFETAEVLIATKEKTQGQWVLDSGCTFHMSPNRNYFTTYQSCDGGMVLMGNNSVCKVVGIGTVSLKMYDDMVRELTQVRHVPELKRNLISIGMRDQTGCVIKAENGTLKVIRGSIVIMKGTKQNGLYVLNGHTTVGEASVTEKSEDKAKLWHLRLGHMSERGLKELKKKGVFGSDKLSSLGFCEDCILGKASRLKFESAVHSTKERLAYIHSDLWGPAQVDSLGGCRYFLSLIDDYSRMVWVYVLKTKDEVLERFKRWKILVETQTSLKVKALRTDNGMEFCNKEFGDFCERHGIMRHKTVIHTPQQNGLAKRMNRTLMDKVRCMLLYSKLPKSLWAEALNTACYLVNRSPSTAIECKTPIELWSGRVADYSKLRIFGCVAYAHVKQGKLEPRALKCRFLGYPDGVKGYRLWCIDLKPPKCIISRDVTFNESEILNNSKATESKEYRSEIKPGSIQFQVESHEQDMIESETEEDAGRVADGSDGVQESEPAENENNSYQLVRDRKRRAVRPPKRYAVADLIAYALTAAQEINEEEPRTYKEAINNRDKLKWKKAMDEEIESLMKNGTWKLIVRPEKRKTVSCKWIFKIKEGISDAEPSRFKARLVARGFTQREGIDFNEIFSPVVKHASIRVILALVAIQDMYLEQMDVKTAFLHGELQEEIVMEQPEGYVVSGKEDHVCLLKKSLYGLKQSPRQWYLKFDSFMTKHAYKRSNYDCCVYFKDIGDGKMIYLMLYVDDMLIACHSINEISHLKDLLSSEFDMKDLGAARKILGMEIIRDRRRKLMFLTQQGYVKKVLLRFGMHEFKSVQTPLANHFKLSAAQCPQTDAEQGKMARIPYSSAVGSLMYAMVLTRPDISHAVSIVSRFMANPGYEHWRAVQWIMRYLKSTMEFGLLYGGLKQEGHKLVGYVDSDFAGDLDKRRSQTCFIFTLGGCTVNWKATLQSVVALSTTEAEYTAAAEAFKEAIWLKGMVSELGAKQETVEVYCDSQSAIHLSKNQTHHERTKHIDVKLHFVRLEVSKGTVKMLKESSDSENDDQSDSDSDGGLDYCIGDDNDDDDDGDGLDFSSDY
ncbi:hypothetical protein KPL71_011175 [Citrus sinensis]|uniref:Uncharacterized protein n=1 Tax=Citrus sinensis TaxID=2711 RepID=A0ACB8L1L3_CITSI|nr:hypothetical protein KPL71_011175 [Citrus sinensis]